MSKLCHSTTVLRERLMAFYHGNLQRLQRCISSAENQKGIINAVHRCSVENQKGINAVHRCSVENQKGIKCCSSMFRWEPEGGYHHRLCTVIVPFWFSTEHCWILIAPFWLSTDKFLLWEMHVIPKYMLRDSSHIHTSWTNFTHTS